MPLAGEGPTQWLRPLANRLRHAGVRPGGPWTRDRWGVTLELDGRLGPGRLSELVVLPPGVTVEAEDDIVTRISTDQCVGLVFSRRSGRRAAMTRKGGEACPRSF